MKPPAEIVAPGRSLARRTAPRGDLPPLERFVRECVDQTGGLWDEIEPQVYDLLLGDEAVRITFDPEALPEHPSAQLASIGSPVMDRMLSDARRTGAHTVLYAGGLNARPHDLTGRLRRAFTVAAGSSIDPAGTRLLFFPQALYHFVATFVFDQKEQVPLEVLLDLHHGREVRQIRRLLEHPLLLDRPVEPLPEAPHLSLEAGFAVACRQVARSVGPLANKLRRDLEDRTRRQIDRMRRYYGRMLQELDQQPRRGPADPLEAAARKQARADAIRLEERLRVTELTQKSALRVILTLSNVLVIHLPKLLVRFDVRSKAGAVARREAVFDLLTESFEPLQTGPGGAPTFDLSGVPR